MSKFDLIIVGGGGGGFGFGAAAPSSFGSVPFGGF